MLIFKATAHRNYALESFITLAQCEWFLPPRQAMQLKYSRFINVHGRQGCNIPCDLYMEHLNKLVKLCVQHLGANKTGKNIQRIGKCIGQVDKILANYDEQHQVSAPSCHHSVPTLQHDRDAVIKELINAKVFSIEPGRQHRHFEKFTCNVMQGIDKKKMEEWMNTQLEKLVDIFAMNT